MRGRTGRTAVALAALAVLAACGGPPAPTPGASPSAGGVEGGEVATLPTFPPSTSAAATPAPSGTPAVLITAVFNDIQARWNAAFAAAGSRYQPAVLRLFSSAVGTACGDQTSEVGPFYCPGDRTVNLDLTFFTALQQQFGVGGFAQAYIVAHEVGHHVQFLLGITARIAQADAHNPSGANALSVRAELQADCFAGVWAHTAYSRNLLTSNDIQQALNAAAVVGDDFLAHLHGGQNEPENWTHGSSAQRQRWFTAGFESGSPDACDTFTPATV